jgi:hypothetical protein
VPGTHETCRSLMKFLRATYTQFSTLVKAVITVAEGFKRKTVLCIKDCLRGCETWLPMLRKEHIVNIPVCKSNELWRTFKSVTDEHITELRKLHREY